MAEGMTDDQLLKLEGIITDRDHISMAPALFCLSQVWNADPESIDARMAQENILRTIAPDNDYSGYQCPVEGCPVGNYRKNPDSKTDEDKEINGVVFWPVDGQSCRFRDFCLEEAWEADEGVEDPRLKEKIKMGAFEYIVDETGLVVGRKSVGSYSCLAAGCELSAGFSEDGVGGVIGTCARKEEEAPEEPLPSTTNRA